MGPWNALRNAHNTPVASLIGLFITWKLLLLTLAIVSPGPGYDTSTQLLFRSYGVKNIAISSGAATSSSIAELLAQKLTRWDAIYFATIAEQGYELEQEWAFGWGLTRLLAFLAKYVPLTSSTLLNITYHGIVVANLSHLLSVFVLYRIALAVPLGKKENTTHFAFVAAALHVLSPAGLFLCAPYGESLFSLLSFLGQLLYVSSYSNNSSSYSIKNDIILVSAGVCFGLSATVRGNGLLSGILLLHDACLWSGMILDRIGTPTLNFGILPPAIQDAIRDFPLRRMPATIIAGLLVAIGFATPQYLAWVDYCSPSVTDRRPWCDRIPPSIYSWVQSEYWGVGFLKYWTLSNVPLFLLATPMLYLMTRSSLLAMTAQCHINGSGIPATTLANHRLVEQKQLTKNESVCANAKSQPNRQRDALLIRLALLQFALAAMALTSFHVQIITRISSGYPLWYLVLAREIVDGGVAETRMAKWTVQWMVIYALVQGVLFSSFLPPA